MSNLIEHAKREMELAGVDDDIYGDMTSKAVLELMEVFSNQGHSGMSASLILGLFTKLARFENLTPLTDNPDEWVHHGEDVWGESDGIWQNRRNGEAFSNDGGKTYYLLSEGGNDRNRHPVHKSQPYKPTE